MVFANGVSKVKRVKAHELCSRLQPITIFEITSIRWLKNSMKHYNKMLIDTLE